ncbi:MAG: extracellular solute-binding protein [Brevinema sp.]
MKKSLILSMLFALAACGGGSSDGKTEIQYWSFFTGGDGGYMEELVNRFNAESTDIKVTMTPVDWFSYYTKLSTSYLSGELPDIAVSHSSRIPTLPTYGDLYSVEDIGDFDWSQFPESTANQVLVDGKHLGVPMDTHGWVMYYNPDLIQGSSLIDAQGNWVANSWDALMKGLGEVQAMHPNIQALGINNPDVAFVWTWYSFYRQAGGQKFLTADGYLDVDIAPATRALNALRDVYTRGYGRTGQRTTSDLMQEGKIAVAFEGVWTAGAIRPKQPQVVGMPIPNFFGKPGGWGDNHILFFPKSSASDAGDKQKAALKFAQWLLDNGASWARAGHVPAKIAVQESDEYKNNPNSVFKDISLTLTAWPKNEYLNLAIDGVLETALQAYLEGAITNPSEVFTKANQEIRNKKQ